MAAVRKNKAIELFWKVHRFLYRVSGGRIGGRAVGMPVLLLTTKGRKSGEPRSNVLTYLPKGEAFVVFASYAGEPKHPAWWLNLAADPRATVQRGGDRQDAVATEVEGVRRAELWRDFAAMYAGLDAYQAQARRRFPVVALTPVST